MHHQLFDPLGAPGTGRNGLQTEGLEQRSVLRVKIPDHNVRYSVGGIGDMAHDCVQCIGVSHRRQCLCVPDAGSFKQVPIQGIALQGPPFEIRRQAQEGSGLLIDDRDLEATLSQAVRQFGANPATANHNIAQRLIS
jgi:hypothetical protein